MELDDGIKYYVRAAPYGDNTSYVVYTVSWDELFFASHRNTPWILSVSMLFIIGTLILNYTLNRSVTKEEGAIREGLNKIVDYQLDYRLPTSFNQHGLPEIAHTINKVGSIFRRKHEESAIF